MDKVDAISQIVSGDLSEQELVELLERMDPEQLAEVKRLAESELLQPFVPNPGPQTRALHSEADILLYGGAAGGGKTALVIGAIAREHSSALVVRREATQLDGLVEFSRTVFGKIPEARFTEQNKTWRWGAKGEKILRFGGIKMEGDWGKYAGIARDLIAFDEAAEFTKTQVFSLIGWLRSVIPGQRKRVILASNPPRGGDGGWVIVEFAPWLDPMHPQPAKDGEIRWAIVVAGETEWVDGPGLYVRGSDEYTAMSRTFIAARLDDNPYLSKSGYRAVLQGLPEPLRSQLLSGDFLAGRQDHDWQVIPTAWIEAAQERWRKAPEKRRQMIAISADIALGGNDALVIGALYVDDWFGEMDAIRGVDVKSPSTIGKEILVRRKSQADTSVDYTGGWGSGVKAWLEENAQCPTVGLVFNSASGSRTADGKFGFANLRAEMWWRLREALDPENAKGTKISLPPDSRLLAELTTPRWELRGTDVLIESKDEIRKRVGGSTDRADVAVMLWHRRDAAIHAALTRRPGHKGRDQYVVEDQVDLLSAW